MDVKHRFTTAELAEIEFYNTQIFPSIDDGADAIENEYQERYIRCELD